jgi:hypothetical protein
MAGARDADAAEKMMAGLRDEVAAGLDEAGFPLRLSVGVATYPFDGASGSHVLRAADQALYEAKLEGKNRTISFRSLVRDGGRSSGGRGQRAHTVTVSEVAALADAVSAAGGIWHERSTQAVIDRLAKVVTFAAGVTGCNVSRVMVPRLVDQTSHALRDSGWEPRAYVIDEFPVTRTVLDTLEPRSISFLDDDLDRAEAFVLRDLGMSCALLVPLVVAGQAWGLVEVYDMRLRRFSPLQRALTEFLVSVASARLEALADDQPATRRVPLYRVPES